MNALNETGAYDEATLAVAEQMFVKAIELDPTFLKAYGQLARVHSDVFWFHVDRSEGRVLMAKATAERAMAIDPDSPDANAAMGWYYYHGRSDYARALESFGRALEGRPNYTDVISGIGFVQRRQGHMEAALVNLLKARELDPQSSEMHYSVGETLVALRRYIEAKRELNESVAKFPGHEWMRLVLARAYVWADGDITSARRVLEDATRVSLTSRVVFAAYNLELWARDFNAALSNLRQIRYPADDNQFTYEPVNYLYGWTYRLMENPKEADVRFEAARAHLETQMTTHPTDPRYPGCLAVTYAALGMRDQAIETMQRAYELQSRAADAWKTAARVHESAMVWLLLEEHERALDDLETLLKAHSAHNPRSIEIDPIWDPLRNNPRFQALVASHS
jgi:serine/threonine-protein kinase